VTPRAWYREFVPCAALRPHVYALFAFGPERPGAPLSRPLLREVAFHDAMAWAPQLADGDVSIRFEVGRTCDATGRWRTDGAALGETVIGPMSGVGRTSALDAAETVGAWFRPGRASRVLDIPIAELVDGTVAVGDVWRSRDGWLSSELAGLSDAQRLDRLEAVLLARVRPSRRNASLDVEGLAASALRRPARATVDGMARAAGVSRQHLAREFRAHIGVGPKLYLRLARFHGLLAHAGAGDTVDWAGAALDLGFADQSHLIAESRRFSGLTPRELAARDWFHPFIERAKASRPRRLLNGRHFGGGIDVG
jgi:AraC-like DNA-binding protein